MGIKQAVALAVLALIACLISLLALLGHILHITGLHTWKENAPAMAINTAICIFVLAAGRILDIAWRIKK